MNLSTAQETAIAESGASFTYYNFAPSDVRPKAIVAEDLVSPEAIGPWLKETNPAFDGSTPLQVIERGETDRIWRMIYELQSGEPA